MHRSPDVQYVSKGKGGDLGKLGKTDRAIFHRPGIILTPLPPKNDFQQTNMEVFKKTARPFSLREGSRNQIG